MSSEKIKESELLEDLEKRFGKEPPPSQGAAMKAFIKAIAFAVPGIIAILLVVWGCYLLATPLVLGQPVETFFFFGRQVTSLQAGLAVFVLGLVIALLSMAGSFRSQSHRSRGKR